MGSLIISPSISGVRTGNHPLRAEISVSQEPGQEKLFLGTPRYTHGPTQNQSSRIWVSVKKNWKSYKVEGGKTSWGMIPTIFQAESAIHWESAHSFWFSISSRSAARITCHTQRTAYCHGPVVICMITAGFVQASGAGTKKTHKSFRGVGGGRTGEESCPTLWPQRKKTWK